MDDCLVSDVSGTPMKQARPPWQGRRAGRSPSCKAESWSQLSSHWDGTCWWLDIRHQSMTWSTTTAHSSFTMKDVWNHQLENFIVFTIYCNVLYGFFWFLCWHWMQANFALRSWLNAPERLFCKAFRAVPAVEQTITVCGWHKAETEAPCWQPNWTSFNLIRYPSSHCGACTRRRPPSVMQVWKMARRVSEIYVWKWGAQKWSKSNGRCHGIWRPDQHNI